METNSAVVRAVCAGAVGVRVGAARSTFAVDSTFAEVAGRGVAFRNALDDWGGFGAVAGGWVGRVGAKSDAGDGAIFDQVVRVGEAFVATVAFVAVGAAGWGARAVGVDGGLVVAA